ncbi:MAG: sulfur transferase domain-containing protein [Acidobacteriota bacterium]
MKNLKRCALLLAACCLLFTPSTLAEAAAEAELIPIRNAMLFEGDVLLGGQPTQEQLKQAAAAGYKTIVNLRPSTELAEWDEREVVEALGLRYVSIPIASATDLDEEAAKRLSEELDREGGRPMMVHCGSGNRVGGLLALEAFHVDGVDAEAALKVGLDNGLTSLAPAIEEYLGSQKRP